MSTILDSIATRHGADKAAGWHSYADIYSGYFEKFNGHPITLLEIGVQYGASIKTWLEYFPHAQIYGVDVASDFASPDPRCHIYQGDQANRPFMAQVGTDAGGFNIIIDDGPHRADTMKTCFEEMWRFVKPGGLYILEDVFVFWDSYFASSVEGTGWLIDLLGHLNHHAKDYYGKPHPIQDVQLTEMESSIHFIHCFKGLVIIGKK